MLEDRLEPFRAAIESVQRLLRRYNDRGVIIGGIAVAFLGRPRLTADVDVLFLLSVAQIPEFLENARSEGIRPRIPDAADFARQHQVLLMIHAPSEIPIDISLGLLPFEEELVDRATETIVGSLQIRLPSPEDLIILKAVAHRPKDLEDIRTIGQKQAGLDRPRIERWVREFGDLMESPGLWESVRTLLDE